MKEYHMKIQINNAEIVDLTMSELYDYWLIDKKSFHHWLTRKSSIKIPPEADTGTWFFVEQKEERSYMVNLKDYIEWWNPLVAYVRAMPVNHYEIVDDYIVYVKFEIYNNNYPEDYWNTK